MCIDTTNYFILRSIVLEIQASYIISYEKTIEANGAMGHAKHQRKQLSSTNRDANTKDLYCYLCNGFFQSLLHFDGLGFIQILVKILLIRLYNIRLGRKSRKLEN